MTARDDTQSSAPAPNSRLLRSASAVVRVGRTTCSQLVPLGSSLPTSSETLTMRDLPRASFGEHRAMICQTVAELGEAGVPFERLVELTGWESELVREGLERVAREPWFLARLAPAGTDSQAIAQAAARFEVTTRLQGLARRVLADVDDDAWSPEPADLADLYDRLESTWREWRHGLGREETKTER